MRRAALIAVVGIGVAVLVWYWSRPEPVRVVLAAVETGVVEATVGNTRAGTVKACRRARLAPAIGGQISKLPVHEGDAVVGGQLLLEMWNDDREAEVELARREVAATEARAEEACTSAEVYARESQRLIRLRRDGLASEEAADKAEGLARSTAAACRAARTGVEVAGARLDVARAALDRTFLRAPFDGTVAEVNGELGEFVTPSPVGIPTPPAVDLIDASCLYITAPIDEVDAPAIRVGMPARITLDAFGDRVFPGRVRRVAPYVLDVEKQARTVDIDVEIEDPDERLLPGYSADVEVILAARSGVLRVPTQAVQAGRALVYRSEDGTLEEREIRTGVGNWEHTEVLSGVAEGDRVVVSVDREGVEPGAAVEPE